MMKKSLFALTAFFATQAVALDNCLEQATIEEVFGAYIQGLELEKKRTPADEYPPSIVDEANKYPSSNPSSIPFNIIKDSIFQCNMYGKFSAELDYEMICGNAAKKDNPSVAQRCPNKTEANTQQGKVKLANTLANAAFDNNKISILTDYASEKGFRPTHDPIPTHSDSAKK